MRINGLCVCAGGALILAMLGGVAAAANPAPPNIVFILADDLGLGDLGFNGQNARAAAGLPAIATPNIDALAAQGMNFTRMYSGAPICAPSRNSLLTGFDMNHVVREHTDVLYEQIRGGQLDKTWGQMLQDAGYRTGMFGKWHLGGVETPEIGVYSAPSTPPQKGFETVFGTMSINYRSRQMWQEDGQGGLMKVPVEADPTWPGPGHPVRFAPDVVAEHVVQFVRDRAQAAAPFAAYVAFEEPHDPFDRISVQQYADKDWPLVQKQYAEMVSRLDQHVGDVLAAIDDPNNDGDVSDSVASNTLVIFASDNGALWTPHASGYATEFFDSNGPFRGEKSNTLEGGIRTPFLVRWTGVTAPGSVNNDYAGSFSDIYPTFAELAGQETPLGLDGVSMLSAITGQGVPQRQDTMVWTTQNLFTGLNQASWAIQMADWKLIRRMSNMAYELYHISADPFETTNLAATRDDIRTALDAIAQLEGLTEEPFFSTGLHDAGANVYYSQYKSWSPAGASTDFNSAGNWGGGTQRNRPSDPDGKYWNTGPGPNWLATVANTLDGYRNAWVNADAKILGLEIRGVAGTMQVNVNPGIELQAYNGVRVEAGGVLRLLEGTLTTARQVEVKQGGKLTGAGLVTGYQDVIAAVPEFAGKGLLEPEVHNAGVIEVMRQNGSAGMLSIDGDLFQSATGELRFDLFGADGVAGVDFDKLLVSGEATLAGSVSVDLAGGFLPEPGQSFAVLSAGGLNLAGLQLTGPDAGLFTMSVIDGTELSLRVISADFDGNGVVDGLDLVAWTEHFGPTSSGLGDADVDGDADGNDFLTWQRRAGIAGSGPANAAVPEPAAPVMAAAASLLLLARRSRGGLRGRRER